MVIIFFLKNTTIYNIIVLCCILLYLYSYHKITIFQCIKFFLNLLTTTFQCSLSFFKYDTVLITFSFAPIERSNFNLLQFYWLLKLIESTPPIIRLLPFFHLIKIFLPISHLHCNSKRINNIYNFIYFIIVEKFTYTTII